MSEYNPTHIVVAEFPESTYTLIELATPAEPLVTWNPCAEPAEFESAVPSTL